MRSDLGEALSREERIQRFISDKIRPIAEKHQLSNMALDKLLAAVGGWSEVGPRVRRALHERPKRHDCAFAARGGIVDWRGFFSRTDLGVF